jgi:SAM-dependent methyltransferase
MATSLGLNAHVIEDAGKLPFADGTMDAIVCLEVLEHLLAPETAVLEAARVLRAGGVFILTVPNVTYWRRRLDLMLGRWNPYGDDKSVAQPWRDPHIRFFNPSAAARLLTYCGLECQVVSGHDGALIADLPVLRRKATTRTGKWSARCQRVLPSVFAARIHIVARKP